MERRTLIGGLAASAGALIHRASAVPPHLPGVFDVRAFGAKGDGSADDTIAVQAALGAASRARGGVVFFPQGNYVVGKLTIPGEVTIQGVGSTADVNGTTLSLKRGTNDHMLDFSGADCYHVTVRDLKLNGNRSNQAGTSNGIHGHRTNGRATRAGKHYFENIVVKGFHTFGVYWGGELGDSTFVNVDVNYSGGHGFNLFGGDCYFLGCLAHQNGGSGFYISGVSHQFSSCKAYLNGETYGGFVKTWPGWMFRESKDVVLAACSSQENYGAGYHFFQSHACSLSGCIADGNGVTARTGAAATRQHDGVEIVRSRGISAQVTCDDFRRRNNPQHRNQRYGVRIDGESSKCMVIASVDNHDAGNELSHANPAGMDHFVVVNGRSATAPDTRAQWNPGTVERGAGRSSAEIAVRGAMMGDFVLVAPPYDLRGATCSGYVSSDGNARIRIQNGTSEDIQLGAGAWRLRVMNPGSD